MNQEQNPFASPQSIESSPTISHVAGRYGPVVPYASGHARAMTTVVCMAVMVIASLLCIGSSYLQIQLLDRAKNGLHVTEVEVKANDQRHIAISGLRSLGFLVTAVSFLMWMHRVYRNLRALGNRILGFSPGSAVGWWFVPFANLVQPYLAMKEIWRGSDPQSFGGTHNQQKASSAVVGWWWAFHLTMGFVLYLATILAKGSTDLRPSLDAVSMSTWTFLIGNVLGCFAAAITIRMILRIDAKQDERFRLVAVSAADPAQSDPTNRLSAWLENQQQG